MKKKNWEINKIILWKAGAMLCEKLKVLSTLEQIPVLYKDVPHSYDHNGPQAWRTKYLHEHVGELAK